RSTALGRVGSFLLETADRFTTESDSPVALPMSRYDIADYLSMAVETVSRALTILRERGIIQFEGVRCVRIWDRDSLKKANEGTSIESVTRPVPIGDHSLPSEHSPPGWPPW